MLKQRFLVQFGSTASVHLIGMLAGILVARLAGPSVVGIVAYGASYVSILGFINGLFGSAHIKLVNEGRDHAACMGVFSRLQAASTIIYLLVIAGWFLAQKYLLHYPFESREVQIVIVIMLLVHFIDQYGQYANTVYTANLKQAKANIPNLVRSLIWHIGRVIIVILGYKAVALSAWNLLLTILLVPFLYRLLREYPLGKYDKNLAREYFRYMIPILIIVVVNSVTHFADKLLLAHYTNTTQLGYYSAAASIGGMFILIAGPVGQIFFPLFSGMIAKGNWFGINNNILKYQEFIVLFVFPLICTLAIAGGPILLMILGQRYQPSINPFIILIFATYLLIWGMPYGNIISGMGKFYLSAFINVVKLVVFAIVITLFISPKFLNLGATGVALNKLVLSFVGNGLYMFFAKKYGELHLGFKNHFRHLIIIVLAVIGYFAAAWLKELMQFWWLIYIPGYILLTYSILTFSKLIGSEHWKLLKEAVNVKKTVTYANNEFKERH